MVLRVLVVDDSVVFRAAVAECLRDDPDITIVGQERNGRRALAFLDANPDGVDLVTLDLEMPEMDGLTTLSHIHERNQSRGRDREIGVIILSAHTTEGARSTIRGLQTGAFDFVAKPTGNGMADSAAQLKSHLLPRMRAWAARRQRNGLEWTRPVRSPAPRTEGTVIGGSGIRQAIPATGTFRRIPAQVVAIGVSTGGPRALTSIMPRLTSLVRLPILIVQHMPPRFTASLADSLARQCGVPVHEAVDGQAIESGHVYIAPGGKHMVVRQTPGGAICGVNENLPENGLRPNVDVLFRSVHAVWGGSVIAAILTGMGNDGTRGLAPLKRAGATVIVQDEATSVVWGMPGSAVAAGLVDHVLPLDRIPEAIANSIR